MPPGGPVCLLPSHRRRVDLIDQTCVFDSRQRPLLPDHQGVPGQLVDVLVGQVEVPVGASPAGLGHQFLLHPGGGGRGEMKPEAETIFSNLTFSISS